MRSFDLKTTLLAAAAVGVAGTADAAGLDQFIGFGDSTMDSGYFRFNPTGTPALASAGTGDVLAGLLVSLLASGLPADRAAISAAFLHGLAGRRVAAQRGGDRAPVTAPDVAEALPAVIGSLT